MESLVTMFSIGFVATSGFLWFSFFRMIRKSTRDDENIIRTAIKALLMLGVALSLLIVAHYTPRLDPYPWADGIFFFLAVGCWSGLGVLINLIIVKNNHPDKSRFQKRVDVFTAVVMISSFTWASIIYYGGVFLPALGLSLEHSFIVMAIACLTLAIYEAWT